MARASFTLRKTTVEQGSYLQYPVTTEGASVAYFPSYGSNGSTSGASVPAREDNDGLLKADDLQTLPTQLVVVPGGNQYAAAAFFTADPVDYNIVRVTWGLPLSTTLTSTPNPTEALVVYSPNGEPSTINDGSILLQTTNTTGEYFQEITSGKWAYYTLFIKYESTLGDLYYEPAARLSTLVPSDYGSLTDLYSKIPVHYRELDGESGPLYRTLDIIAWDINKFRTLLDYMMVSKDPQNARSEELDLIAADLGFDMRSQDLGAYRLRMLLDNIGTLRRFNGTELGVTTAATSLTGSFVGLDVQNKRLYVQPQRVNFLKDPRLKLGIGDSLDGGTPFSSTTFSVDAGPYNVSSTTSTLDGGSPSETYTTPTGNSLWQVYPTGDPARSALYTSTAYLKLLGGETYYFSAQPVGLNSKVQEAITRVSFYTASSLGASTPPVVIATTEEYINVGNVYFWKLDIPTSYSDYTEAYIEIEFDNTGIVVSEDFKLLMLEKNNIGTFFDGDTVEGGWIVDGSNSISDYRWLNAQTPDAVADYRDFSVFSANFQKTKAVLNKLQSLVIPVTELTTSGTVYSNRPTTTTYDVVYNYIPGYTVIASALITFPVGTGGMSPLPDGPRGG